MKATRRQFLAALVAAPVAAKAAPTLDLEKLNAAYEEAWFGMDFAKSPDWFSFSVIDSIPRESGPMIADLFFQQSPFMDFLSGKCRLDFAERNFDPKRLPA